jgi:hypothetical protein
MPYIKEEDRRIFDSHIDDIIFILKCSLDGEICQHQNLSDQQTMMLLGKINYCFSRILSGVTGDISYSKVAMITGVIENIKQEYYRRVASIYEDKKILENGDIREYKRLQ